MLWSDHRDDDIMAAIYMHWSSWAGAGWFGTCHHRFVHYSKYAATKMVVDVMPMEAWSNSPLAFAESGISFNIRDNLLLSSQSLSCMRLQICSDTGQQKVGLPACCARLLYRREDQKHKRFFLLVHADSSDPLSRASPSTSS